jgi:hypothetical protein
VRNGGLGEQRLSGAVLLGEQQRGGVSLDDAGVGEQGDAGILRGADHVAVLAHALADLAAGHEQDLLGPGERLSQRSLVVVVGPADDDAAVGEVGEGVRAAARRDQLRGGNTAVQQGLDDETAEVATGSGDDDGHAPVLLAWREPPRAAPPLFEQPGRPIASRSARHGAGEPRGTWRRAPAPQVCLRGRCSRGWVAGDELRGC